MSWTPETYGQRWIGIYDRMGWPDPAPATAFLAERAGTGPVLELAIGTGRVALPLAATGIQVHGLDASTEMIEAMRRKPGGADVPVTVADLADFRLDGRYTMIYLVLHGLFWLQSQDDQVACFRRAAEHLHRGGLFITETFVPDPSRFQSHGTMQVHDAGASHVWIEAGTHDRARQQVMENHIMIRESGIKLYPSSMRYAWPAELDLMARLAGMENVGRYGDWTGQSFSKWSDDHIGVYRKL